MKLLFIGDVVGSPRSGYGQRISSKIKRKISSAILPLLMVKMLQVVAGLQKRFTVSFLEWGAQAVTLGNHTWDNREIFKFIDDAKYLVRPANFPEGTLGRN